LRATVNGVSSASSLALVRMKPLASTMVPRIASLSLAFTRTTLFDGVATTSRKAESIRGLSLKPLDLSSLRERRPGTNCASAVVAMMIDRINAERMR
jgi:hypothetical protein